MLDAAGGGGGTDWWGMSMEKIHSSPRAPDIDAQYQIVDGWQKSADLVGDHMSQVQDYRDALATAWPPEKSTAAKAYLDSARRSDQKPERDLRGDTRQPRRHQLGQPVPQPGQVRDGEDLQPVGHEQQDAAGLQPAAGQKAQQANSGKPTPSPSPSGDEPPPVTASQQEALRQKAVTLMSSVSSDLAEAQLKVVTPSPLQPADFIGQESPVKAEPVPPACPSSRRSFPSHIRVVPAVLPAAVRSRRPTARLLPDHAGRHAPAPGSTFPGGGGGNPGLVLGGTNPPSTRFLADVDRPQPDHKPARRRRADHQPGDPAAGHRTDSFRTEPCRRSAAGFPGEGGGFKPSAAVSRGRPEGDAARWHHRQDARRRVR